MISKKNFLDSTYKSDIGFWYEFIENDSTVSKRPSGDIKKLYQNFIVNVKLNAQFQWLTSNDKSMNLAKPILFTWKVPLGFKKSGLKLERAIYFT